MHTYLCRFCFWFFSSCSSKSTEEFSFETGLATLLKTLLFREDRYKRTYKNIHGKSCFSKKHDNFSMQACIYCLNHLHWHFYRCFRNVQNWNGNNFWRIEQITFFLKDCTCFKCIVWYGILARSKMGFWCVFDQNDEREVKDYSWIWLSLS